MMAIEDLTMLVHQESNSYGAYARESPCLQIIENDNVGNTNVNTEDDTANNNNDNNNFNNNSSCSNSSNDSCLGGASSGLTKVTIQSKNKGQIVEPKMPVLVYIGSTYGRGVVSNWDQYGRYSVIYDDGRTEQGVDASRIAVMEKVEETSGRSLLFGESLSQTYSSQTNSCYGTTEASQTLDGLISATRPSFPAIPSAALTPSKSMRPLSLSPPLQYLEGKLPVLTAAPKVAVLVFCMLQYLTRKIAQA